MALELKIFMKISVFRTFFEFNFADIEMKLGMIVFNNELQIKFEFLFYWSILALGFRILMKIYFSDIF
jgi:hypothetical protein